MRRTTKTSQMAQNLGPAFNQVTDEEGKKHIEVTITFKGTGVEVRGVVDPSHGLYSVTLDGKKWPSKKVRAMIMRSTAIIISVAMETNASSTRVWSICKA